MTNWYIYINSFYDIKRIKMILYFWFNHTFLHCMLISAFFKVRIPRYPKKWNILFPGRRDILLYTNIVIFYITRHLIGLESHRTRRTKISWKYISYFPHHHAITLYMYILCPVRWRPTTIKWRVIWKNHIEV